MPTAALMVVDMLNYFFDQHPQLASQRPQLVASTNALIQEFRKRKLPVIWIRQEFKPDLSDSFLEMRKSGVRVTIAGTRGCEIVSDLDRDKADPVIVKKRYSAFFRTDMDGLLDQLEPTALVICGINTHACVRMTALDAYQRDYDVIVAADCIASYDPDHHEMTKGYLGRGIARVLSNEDLFTMLPAE
jgi:nicotinamidase-related amidase